MSKWVTQYRAEFYSVGRQIAFAYGPWCDSIAEAEKCNWVNMSWESEGRHLLTGSTMRIGTYEHIVPDDSDRAVENAVFDEYEDGTLAFHRHPILGHEILSIKGPSNVRKS